MKIVTVVGARPQFVKAAALSRVIRKEHQEILVHTGQHYDSNMSDVFFEEMHIPKPDYHLNISGGSHGSMTGKMLIALEEVFITEKPDAVLVFGDTNSTAAAALAAVKLHIPIIHVEAGNRLGTLENPEEVNRILTDHLSTLLVCATDEAKSNLEKENLGSKSYVVGNIMYDSFKFFAEGLKSEKQLVLEEQNVVVDSKQFYYMTCHREENTYSDEALSEILSAMNSLDYPTVYPVHPRNRERAQRICANNRFKNIILMPPVKYSESVWLTLHARKIVTDSGGLQCEAFFAGTQCVTIFNYAAWPETLVGNRNQLAKSLKDDILNKLSEEQNIDEDYQPFGDGHTAESIVGMINQKIGEKQL